MGATVAVGLISGGLDSMLAACVLLEQGIRVQGLAFTSPFFTSRAAEEASRQIGFPLLIHDLTLPLLELVKDPPSGYGKNMNPCIDCHALMLRLAGGIMEERGADFLFTGEVLNERPFSQNRRSLNRVARLSGYRDLIVRPLSARLLKKTRPEKEEKVDRSRLFDIQGRSRRHQFALAAHYGLRQYPLPAGGCLLTDRGFSRRLRDLIDHGPTVHPRAVEALKVGRHFRLRDGVKALVGRNETENQKLLSLRGPGDVLLWTPDIPGPVVLLCGEAGQPDLLTAASLCARYSDGRGAVTIRYDRQGCEETIVAGPLPPKLISGMRL